jgi:hypothetical protein
MPGPLVKCLLCEDVIQSQYRHDFVTCKCGNLSVDGGVSYLRIVTNLHTSVEVLPEEVQ